MSDKKYYDAHWIEPGSCKTKDNMRKRMRFSYRWLQ